MFDMVSRRGFVSLSAVAAAGLGLAGCSGNKTSEPALRCGFCQDFFQEGRRAAGVRRQLAREGSARGSEALHRADGTTFADTQFKASGDLVEQMRAGAAVDVLITASKGTMDDAEAAELVDADTREDMFVNDLVIIRAEAPTPRSRPSPTSRTWTARLPSATLRPFPPASMPTKRWLLLGSTPVPRATTASVHPSSPTRWPWPTRSAPPQLTSLRATAWPALSTAPTSSATTASRRPSCAPRIRTSHRVSGCRCRELRARRRGQGVHRLLSDQQEGAEDLG